MSKKKSSKHDEDTSTSTEKAQKPHVHHDSGPGKESGKGALRLLVKLFIIVLIIAAAAFYVYQYQPDKWNAAKDWLGERFMGEQPSDEDVTINFNEVHVSEDQKIPEEYYEGHASAGGEISQADAETKMRAEFTIDEGDVVMAWPEMLKKGEWLEEATGYVGQVGKLSSDAWLFWVDKPYGSMYPHPTYYIAVYGDGYVDVFMGSFTPKVGDDDWLASGTKARLIQGSLELEEYE